MDMSSKNPSATLSVSADLKLIDATGRPFSISIDYAGSLKVSTIHGADMLDMNVIRALTCLSSNFKQPCDCFLSTKNQQKIALSSIL